MRWARLALAGALSLAACGGKNEWAGSQEGGGTHGGGGGQDAAPCSNGVALRLVGVDPVNVTSLSLTLGAITATYQDGGAAISITAPPAGPFLLDGAGQDLGVLHLASLTHAQGEARVGLSFASGSAALLGIPGVLDFCAGAFTFLLDPSLVQPGTCRVDLRLAVGRTVVTSGRGLAFLPQFRVVYR